MYKKRSLQARLSLFNLLLMLGSAALIGYYAYIALSQTDGAVHYNFPLILPIVGIIFTFMARKSILKDEKLIKSIDRIR